MKLIRSSGALRFFCACIYFLLSLEIGHAQAEIPGIDRPSCSSLFNEKIAYRPITSEFNRLTPRLFQGRIQTESLEYEIYIDAFEITAEITEYLSWLLKEIEEFLVQRADLAPLLQLQKIRIRLGLSPSLYFGPTPSLDMPLYLRNEANDFTQTLIEAKGLLHHELSHLLFFSITERALQDSPLHADFFEAGRFIMEETFWSELYKFAVYSSNLNPSWGTSPGSAKSAEQNIQPIRQAREEARNMVRVMEQTIHHRLRSGEYRSGTYGANADNDIRLQGSVFINNRLNPYAEVVGDFIALTTLGNHSDYFAPFEKTVRYLADRHRDTYTYEEILSYYRQGRGFTETVDPRSWTHKDPHFYFAPVRSYLGRLLNDDHSNRESVLQALITSLDEVVTTETPITDITAENQAQLNQEWISKIESAHRPKTH